MQDLILGRGEVAKYHVTGIENQTFVYLILTVLLLCKSIHRFCISLSLQLKETILNVKMIMMHE